MVVLRFDKSIAPATQSRITTAATITMGLRTGSFGARAALALSVNGGSCFMLLTSTTILAASFVLHNRQSGPAKCSIRHRPC